MLVAEGALSHHSVSATDDDLTDGGEYPPGGALGGPFQISEHGLDGRNLTSLHVQPIQFIFPCITFRCCN
jgi:hypothetical protein